MSLNKIIIMGRMVSDPTIRYTQSQTPVASFTLAVDRDFSQDKETDFVNCVAWRKTAEFIHQNFTKGKMTIAAGRLQSRKWTDKDGKNRIEWEVIVNEVYFGESKKNDEGSPFPPGVVGRVDRSKFQELPETDGDLPF